MQQEQNDNEKMYNKIINNVWGKKKKDYHKDKCSSQYL